MGSVLSGRAGLWHLSSRTGKRRPRVGTGKSLARAKPNTLCEKLPHAHSAQRRRARFPRADERNTGELGDPCRGCKSPVASLYGKKKTTGSRREKTAVISIAN